MEIEEINISLIKPSKYNPRKISDFDYKNLKRNIKEFGLVQPLVINKNNNLIGGHQRLKALKELGYKTVKVVRSE